MSGNYISQAAIFLVQLFFDIFILAFLLRYLLTKLRINSYNPLSEVIIRVTNPVLKPLRRMIPGYYGVDWSSIVALLLIQSLEIIITQLIIRGDVIAINALFILTMANLLKMILYIYMFTIIIQVIISWINPGAYNPIVTIMSQLTDPILRPVRRIASFGGGLDFSPLIVLVIIQLLMILIISPLMEIGFRLSY
ncbi:MAG: hypothetical protein CMF40_03845 [Legionellales bacterium]|nr:hypothetical protein [Legionellales bacterium]